MQTKKEVTRKDRCAKYVAHRHEARARFQEMRDAAAEKLRQGYRVKASALGALKKPPVRDPKTGRVDVLATAEQYGLWDECPDAETQQWARWDAGEIHAQGLRSAL